MIKWFNIETSNEAELSSLKTNYYSFKMKNRDMSKKGGKRKEFQVQVYSYTSSYYKNGNFGNLQQTCGNIENTNMK